MLAVTLGGGAATASAEVPPFYPTQLVDGELADTTRWYTMTIGEAAFVIGTPQTDYIALNSKKLTLEENHLWCFVGDEVTGYTLYNKAAGVTKVLAAPTTITATDAATKFATLIPANATEGYTTRWSILPSSLRKSKYAVKGIVLRPFGKDAVAVSNRNGKLAFNTTSTSQDETILVEFGRQRRYVNLTTGAFTKSNGGKTWHSEWTSHAATPQLLFQNTGGKNNMQGTSTSLSLSSVNTNTYRVTTAPEYIVVAYGFDFTANKAQTVTGGGKSVTAAANTTGHFTLGGLTTPSGEFSFSQASVNDMLTVSNFYVLLERSFAKVEERHNLFVSKPGGTPYRIPAIESTSDGRLLAFTDLRPGGRDIGYGLVHVKMRASEDYGKTWGEEQSIATGTGNSADGYKYAYGDVAVVADRESPNVLMHVCAGSVGYFSSSYSNPLRMAHFRSADGGRTWDKGVEVTDHFLQLFADRKRGNMNSMFVTSGRIHQSRYVKKGQYYRLYAGLATREEGNYCLYSDDFGYTWHILGDRETSPISDGDEVKCEELPDGSVILSSRAHGQRLFNVFTFSNALEGKGAWGIRQSSNSNNKGIAPQGNATDAEAIMIPAVRKSDGKKLPLLLHTIPFGNGRTNVGFYYKEAATYDQVGTPEALVKDWVKGKQVSQMGSAYSSCVLQKNDSIGILYEESTFGADYTIVYKSYSVEDITNGQYGLELQGAEKLDSMYLQTAVEGRVAPLRTGQYVGQLTDLSEVQSAKAAYLASPSKATAEAVVAAIVDPAKRVALAEGKWYRLINKQYPTQVMTANTTTLATMQLNRTNVSQLFQVKRGDKGWYLIHGNMEAGAGTILGDNVKVPVAALNDAPTAGTVYDIVSDTNGETTLSSMVSQNKKHNYLHRAGNGNVVGWTDFSEASRWNVEPVDSFLVTLDASPDNNSFYRPYCLPFGYTVVGEAKAYKAKAVSEDKVQFEAVESVPSQAGVLLKNNKNTLWLHLSDNTATLTDNLLVGTLKNKTVAEGLTFVSNTTTEPQFAKRTTTMQGNRAYLQQADGRTRWVTFEDISTGISVIQADFEADRAAFYDLIGRRHSQPLKGVMIQKGKKVIY